MRIVPFAESHIPSAVALSDLGFGAGFYTAEHFRELVEGSTSFVLVDEERNVRGLRMSYGPGEWPDRLKKGITADQWRVPPEHTGYFRTILIDPSLRGGGWATRLSNASLEALEKNRAQAVFCHCWKESPGDASRRYLEKLGFEAVAEHADFWIEFDYDCNRCGSPCRCTAIEMIKYL